MRPRFKIWISLPMTFFATTVVMMLFSGHSLSAQELNASDGEANDDFGGSVSLSGNTGLIGARFDRDDPVLSGSAYLFRNLDTATGTVNESVKLFAGVTFARFGTSVSLSGNTGLISAPDDDNDGIDSGSAYLFRNLDTATGTVSESVKLIASDGADGDQFGTSVSLSGNTGLIGVFGDVDNGERSGSAYLFRDLDTATGTVNESVKLLPSDGAINDGFGDSVSLSGNTGLIGAADDDFGLFSGSAYVFRNLDTATGTVNESVKLLPSDGVVFSRFGAGFGGSVSLSGNTGLIGARFDADNGSAYVFRNLDTATGTVNESVKLIASDGEDGDQFGFSVSLSGNTGLIGATADDPTGSSRSRGSAYLFRNLNTATGTVNESVRLFVSDGGVYGTVGVGSSVSLDGDRFTVGANLGSGVTFDTGSAYTGTVSSVTTLDFGNTSAIIDRISFQSRTDWIIGETTSSNHIELTLSDSAEILESDTGIFVGANADSNDNSLTISGSVMATRAGIGAAGNVGNQLILNSTATNLIETLSLHENNSLLIEGEFTTFELLGTELGSTDLFAVLDGNSQLITDLNFDTLLRTSFDGTTGYTTFTATVEPLLLGDVDRNGVVDSSDISPFISLLAAGQFQAEADIDQSGIVDFEDISPFVSLLTAGKF